MRASLKLSGKTPLIGFDDADLNLAVATIVQALIAMKGQFFVTGSRVLVQRGIADTVWAALTIIIQGYVRIDLHDGAVHLAGGEMFVVPKGVKHKPFAEKRCRCCRSSLAA